MQVCFVSCKKNEHTLCACSESEKEARITCGVILLLVMFITCVDWEAYLRPLGVNILASCVSCAWPPDMRMIDVFWFQKELV